MRYRATFKENLGLYVIFGGGWTPDAFLRVAVSPGRSCRDWTVGASFLSDYPAAALRFVRDRSSRESGPGQDLESAVGPDWRRKTSCRNQFLGFASLWPIHLRVPHPNGCV